MAYSTKGASYFERFFWEWRSPQLCTQLFQLRKEGLKKNSGLYGIWTQGDTGAVHNWDDLRLYTLNLNSAVLIMIFNNYPPSRLGKYPSLFTDTGEINCFSITKPVDSQHQIVPFFRNKRGKTRVRNPEKCRGWIADAIPSLRGQSERAKNTIHRFD